MEPILVYGYPSGTSMGLVAALEWLGQPYRLSRVDMLGEMREPPYKRINQRVETPVLITDKGRPLTETMAIAAYLEARDTERRISFDPLSPEADRMHQLMGFLNTGFTGAFGPLWVALELPEPDPDFEAALRRFGRERVIERHDRLEEMLDGSSWLVGDKHSLADGLLAGVARWLEYHEVADISRWPKLRALRQRVESDPAVVFATALEDGATPAGSGALKGHLPLAEVIARYGV
ncbi:glutathione S-transferase family protein [Bosea sp. (in: a-proteobacteria)]|uniref:glutathione S-transferase family protein n=1 Tax=Bosea sp. (in: a-proteobacteria) TaxID=1871050 RepID=UPI0025BF2FCE|nr:glutathione S-transferase family protein [Bosea sp. (in: a-proteobacteria)]MBR3194911.1 glutathione S-transferase family protein [Bosea sp. (in: a-proteobacteria)]